MAITYRSISHITPLHNTSTGGPRATNGLYRAPTSLSQTGHPYNQTDGAARCTATPAHVRSCAQPNSSREKKMLNNTIKQPKIGGLPTPTRIPSDYTVIDGTDQNDILHGT